MQRAKSHFYTSAEVPEFGTDLVAVCGETVKKAESLLWATSEAVSRAQLQVSCYQCNKREFKELEYFAVIAGGQEALNEERGR